MNGFQRIGEDCSCQKNLPPRPPRRKLNVSKGHSLVKKQHDSKRKKPSSRVLVGCIWRIKKLLRLNKELESTLQNLNETLGALTSAKAKRLAIIVTLVLATILFFVTEFALEPILEEKIESGLFLIIAKGMIFATLIPVEIIGSRLAERNLTESGKINESIYRDLLLSAYEDGVITDMERNLLQSSARQLGISKTRADLIEQEFAKDLD